MFFYRIIITLKQHIMIVLEYHIAISSYLKINTTVAGVVNGHTGSFGYWSLTQTYAQHEGYLFDLVRFSLIIRFIDHDYHLSKNNCFV